MGQSVTRNDRGGLLAFACLASVGWPGLAFAQDAGRGDLAAHLSDHPEPKLSVSAIPALTPVAIRIEQELGSKLSHSGDTFRISLAEPVLVEGTELVPAGVQGMGEVVHAKKGGFGGAAGELVLAVRYLEVDGRHLNLRSLAYLGRGKDNTDLTAAVGIAAGFPALFINGGNTVVPPGTIVTAKTKEEFALHPVPAREADSDSSPKEGVTNEN